MTDVVFNNLTKDKNFGPRFFEKVVRRTVKYLGLSSKKTELSVNLVGEAKIRFLNRKYRKKNKATDVLSFPLNEKVDAKSRIGGIIPLGDIFICLPVAKKDAEKEGVGLDFKLAFLFIHGFLHLLGHEHEKSEKDKKKMFDLQSRIMKNLDL